MKKQFGFGIIGTGMIAHTHAKAIAEIEGASLIGVYNRTKDKAINFGQQYQCEQYDSLDEMLQNDRIDIVCICTASGFHLEPALACIEAGKHCLIEKPLEVTVERCDKIINAAKSAGIKVGVIFPSRFYKASKDLKKALDKERFGSLVMGDAYVKWYRSPEYYRSGKWRGTWALDGGGALMNQGIHSVDLLQWYMGPIKSVQAMRTNALHKSIEVEDTIVAIVQFANGALGTIECSTAIFPGAKKRIEIRGTEGSAVLEGDDLIEWEFKNEENEDDRILNGTNSSSASTGGAVDPSDISFKGHQLQIIDMIEALKEDTELFISAEEGKKSVAITEAIYQSADTGKRY